MMRRYLLPGLAVVIALSYPILTAATPVYQRLGALVLLAAIGASAWNLVGGYAGQVSVGHAVFFGAGAYAAIAGYTHFGLPPIAGAPIGAPVKGFSNCAGTTPSSDFVSSDSPRAVAAAGVSESNPVVSTDGSLGVVGPTVGSLAISAARRARPRA